MTIGVLQSASGQSTGVTTLGQAYGSAITAGSALRCVACWADTEPTCTATGTRNGALTSRGVIHDTTAGVFYQHFTLDNAAAGTETLTITVSGGTTPTAIFVYIEEIGGTSGYDTQASQILSAPGTGTDAVTSGNLTLTVQPGLISAFGADVTGTGTPVPTVGTGFTSTATAWAGGSGNFARAENLRYTSTSPRAGTFTATTGNGGVVYGVLAAAFKETGAVTLGSQTATFTQGAFSASNDTPVAPIRSAPLAPLTGNKALGPLGLGGFALRRQVNAQVQTGTVSLGSQTATFTQGAFTANSTGSATMGAQTATFSQGTFSANSSGSAALGSQTATFSQGTMTANSSGTAALGSQTATFSQGTMTANSTGSATLGSQTATFSQGTMTSSSSGGGTVAMGSQTATFSQGNMGIAGSNPFGPFSPWYNRRHNRRRY